MKVYLQAQLSETQQINWLSFWNNCKHAHPRQHLLCAEIEKAKDRIPLFAFGEENGKIAAIGVFSIRPLFKGNKFSFEAVCLRGPAFDNSDHGKQFLLQVIPLLKSIHIGSIRVSPAWYFPDAEPVKALLKEMNFMPYSGDTRAATGLIDLQGSTEEIFAAFSQSTRREVRRAERNQVTIRPATSIEEGLYFFKELDTMQHERGLTPIPFNEFRETMDLIFKEQDIGTLLNAYHGETFLGGLWIIRSSRVAHAARYVVVNEALRKISNLSIGPILWLHGMIWAKEKGCRFLDMEGCVEATDESSPTYQVQKFKKRFAPVPIDKINEHIYICNSSIQFLFKGYSILKQINIRIATLPYFITKMFSSYMQRYRRSIQ